MAHPGSRSGSDVSKVPVTEHFRHTWITIIISSPPSLLVQSERGCNLKLKLPNGPLSSKLNFAAWTKVTGDLSIDLERAHAERESKSLSTVNKDLFDVSPEALDVATRKVDVSISVSLISLKFRFDQFCLVLEEIRFWIVILCWSLPSFLGPVHSLAFMVFRSSQFVSVNGT